MENNLNSRKKLSNPNNNTIPSLTDKQKNNIKDESKNEEEEELNPAKEVKTLLGILLEFYGKKQYKKLLKLIEAQRDKEEELKNEFNIWKITFLKIISIQKVIEKKIIKNYKKKNIPKFDEYLLKENKELFKWILFSYQNIDKKKFINSFNEISIQFLLQKCINFSKYCIHFEKIKDAIGFLSLGLRLIMNTKEFFISPVTLSLSGELLLQLSSLLIAESNFETAKNCINIIIKFLFLSLEIRLVNENISLSLINLKKNSEEELSTITKILFHMSIAFYQLGVCYENENDDYNSFYAYKTSKWFGELISYDKKTDMYIDLIEDINTRQLMRNRIIIFFEHGVTKEELQDVVHHTKKINSKLSIEEEKKKLKNEKIITYIENLNLKDVDDGDPDLFNKVGCKPYKENVIKSTKQIRLLNYLMSDDFKEMVRSMKKIEINKLNKDTINAIQKKIINIKNNERHRLAKQLKEQKSIEKFLLYKDKKNILNTPKLREAKTYKIKTPNNTYNIPLTQKLKKRPESECKSAKKKNLYTDINLSNNKYSINNTESFYSMNTRPNTATFYNKSYNKNNFNRDKIINTRKYTAIYKDKKFRNTNNNLSVKKFKNKSANNDNKKNKIIFKYNYRYIQKYDYNEYHFNKCYKKKQEFLERQYDRELDFQKNLLRTKFNKEEVNEKIPDVDIRNINKKCENYYYTTFLNELMSMKDEHVIFDKTEINSNIKQSKKNKKEDKMYFLTPSKKEVKFKEKIQIQDINEGYINDITHSIMKINSEGRKINKNLKKLNK